MTQSLPRKADVYFLTQFLLPRWDETNTLGYNPNDAPGGEGFLDSADSFTKTGEGYPQFTVQTTGEESSGGESSYDYITRDGPGQNRTGTLTAQVRVEDSDSDYTTTRDYGEGAYGGGLYGEYDSVDAERLAVLIRQEIERICLEYPTGADTEFSFVGSNANAIPDETDSTRVVHKEGATLSYGYLRD